MTEKMINSYQGVAVPIYWGGGSKLFHVFNKRAFVHCDIPLNLTNLLKSSSFIQSVDCDQKSKSSSVIDEAKCLETVMYNLLLPYFIPCVEEIDRLDKDDKAYEQMIAEPLAVMDGDKLVGVWDETRYGEGIRAAFDVLGYENGPNELRRIVYKLKT